MIEHEDTTEGPNPRRIHFNAGTAKAASGATFAGTLRTWFYTVQQVFPKQQDFAVAIGASPEAVQGWFAGKAFPTAPFCDKLYELTKLECFSLSGRAAARQEHEKKKGLSRSAIQKREQRQYLTPEELGKCQADPELAFTIRGEGWIACLECGQLLEQIRAVGKAAHLREHGVSDAQYRIGPDPDHPRYGPSRPLISIAYAARKRASRSAQNLRPDAGLANLRPQKKGVKMPPEHARKQSARKLGEKNEKSHLGKLEHIADIRFVWPWLFEGKSREEIAKEIGSYTPGGVWAKLERIFGTPVKNRVTREDLQHAAKAVEFVRACAGDDEKRKSALQPLFDESRKTRKKDRAARTVLLWTPRVRTWFNQKPERRAMASADLARIFEAEQIPKLKQRHSTAGRKRGMTPERKAEAERLLKESAKIVSQQGKRGAITKAADIVYSHLDKPSRSGRARKVLADYRKEQNRYK